MSLRFHARLNPAHAKGSIPIPKLLAAYACVSAVYLLYVPHALPVLDDWTALQWFDRARAGGISGSLEFLHRLIDNSWAPQFRVMWASWVPVFGLFFAAGFHPCPYFLLALVAHLFTAVLLCRIMSLFAGAAEMGFAAGAIYVVFPAANNPLLWPISTCFYYLQVLAFAWWFYATWKKLAAAQDRRYQWKDFLLLIPVVFTGEQILPALLLLPLLAAWLFSEPEMRRRNVTFCSVHAVVMLALLGTYVFLLNRMPIHAGFQNRYGHPGWNPRSFGSHLLGSLGVGRDFAGWRPSWHFDPLLAAVLALATVAFLSGGWRRPAGPAVSPRLRGKLLLWSVAGVILSYIPVAGLDTFEWRYLYVPSLFLVCAGTVLLENLKWPVRSAFALVTLIYCLSQTYFEIRQCWIPQSRVARAVLSAVKSAAPFDPQDVLIFSGAPLAIGPAPDFITGASWATQSMLEHATGFDHIQGARDLVVNESGELALYRRDSFRWFHRTEVGRLRVFVRNRDNHFVARTVLALPGSDGRYQLFALRPAAERAVPAETLTMEELKRQPWFGEIYFARRIHNHAKPTDL